ncbi:hypothetical protein Tco_0164731 [Tanacetum coccineum]
MAARGGRNNIVARRVIDDLIDISGERSPLKYLNIFIEQQFTDHRWFIARMRDEIRTSTNLISQLNALIAELEAFGDYEEVFDLVMELRGDRRNEQDKVADFNRLIAVVEEKIHGKEIDLEMLEAEGNDVAVRCATRIMETQAIDDQDPLVNYDNDNENDDLGYQSEEYFDEVQEDDENNHSNGNVVKRGITRFEDSILERWIQKQDDNFGMEITRYFDVDLTVKKLVMNRLGQLLRNFRRKLRQTYILPNQNTLSKLNEVPAKYSAILQAEEWVNFVKYTATEEYKVKSTTAKMARSKSVYQHTMGRGGYTLVKEKMKETEDKIKEGTLKVDHGTDAMTVVLGKEKGGYARGVGSGVTYKRYFDLPRSRQASDERILLLQSQLDNERRERQEKELLIQNLSNKMSQTEGMVTKLKNQLAAQGGQFQSMSTQLTPQNVSSVDINPINRSADEEGGTTIVGCENDASIRKSNGLVTLEKEIETRVSNKTSPCKTDKSVGSKKMTRSIRKDSSCQDSQSQENVSPLLVLPQAIKCKLWHFKKSTIIALGTVYKTNGKQMLHNKELLKDCYKVSVDKSLVDAACIPDVGNNGFKTVKDAVGKDNGRIILTSVENGPLVCPIVALENSTVRPKTYEELSDKEKLQADCDLRATNIVLQVLPPDVYALVNHHKVSKDKWDRVKLLMQGTSLSKQERECKLYDEFDKFSYVKGETLHQYYLRFAQLINDMNIIQMIMQPVQVNTKFLIAIHQE